MSPRRNRRHRSTGHRLGWGYKRLRGRGWGDGSCGRHGFGDHGFRGGGFRGHRGCRGHGFRCHCRGFRCRGLPGASRTLATPSVHVLCCLVWAEWPGMETLMFPFQWPAPVSPATLNMQACPWQSEKSCLTYEGAWQQLFLNVGIDLLTADHPRVNSYRVRILRWRKPKFRDIVQVQLQHKMLFPVR